MHHPFTAPNVDDLAHGRSIGDSRALAYDMVYNGSEIGGGGLHESPACLLHNQLLIFMVFVPGMTAHKLHLIASIGLKISAVVRSCQSAECCLYSPAVCVL